MKEIRKAFTLELVAVNRFVTAVHEVDAAGTYLRPPDERALVTQAAFLRTFIAFESFLESSFTHLMMGHSNQSGWKPNLYVAPPDVSHALRMTVGLMRFMDWSTPDRVRELAGQFFEGGEPFESSLSAAHGDLLDMKTIRNSAAHLSSTTGAALDALFVRKTGLAIRNVTAYQVVTHVNPASGDSLLTEYMYVLDATADAIADHT